MSIQKHEGKNTYWFSSKVYSTSDLLDASVKSISDQKNFSNSD